MCRRSRYYFEKQAEITAAIKYNDTSQDQSSILEYSTGERHKKNPFEDLDDDDIANISDDSGSQKGSIKKISTQELAKVSKNGWKQMR